MYTVWRLVGNRWPLVCNRWRLVGNRWRLVCNRWRLVGSHQTSESRCHSKKKGGGERPYGTPWSVCVPGFCFQTCSNCEVQHLYVLLPLQTMCLKVDALQVGQAGGGWPHLQCVSVCVCVCVCVRLCGCVCAHRGARACSRGPTPSNIPQDPLTCSHTPLSPCVWVACRAEHDTPFHVIQFRRPAFSYSLIYAVPSAPSPPCTMLAVCAMPAL